MSQSFFNGGEKSFKDIKEHIEKNELLSLNTLKTNEIYEYNGILFKKPSTQTNEAAWKFEMVLFLTQKKSQDELPELDLTSNVFKFKVKYKIESDDEKIISIPFHYNINHLIEELEFQSLYSFKLSSKSLKINELLWKTAKNEIIKLNKTVYTP